MNDVSQKDSRLIDSAKLVLFPNAFVPHELQQRTESQVEAIVVQMNEIKCKREELELQAQKEIDELEEEHADINLKHPPVHSSKLRRMWSTRDALFKKGDALEQLYFVYKLAASGLRWISPSELANVPEEEVMTVIEVLHGKAAYVDGYEQYATHDIRVVLQCLKSSTGKIRLLNEGE
ncbi:MAG: hypothetical protein ACXVIG_02750 [Halobacteriota archaeon]